MYFILSSILISFFLKSPKYSAKLPQHSSVSYTKYLFTAVPLPTSLDFPFFSSSSSSLPTSSDTSSFYSYSSDKKKESFSFIMYSQVWRDFKTRYSLQIASIAFYFDESNSTILRATYSELFLAFRTSANAPLPRNSNSEQQGLYSLSIVRISPITRGLEKGVPFVLVAIFLASAEICYDDSFIFVVFYDRVCCFLFRAALNRYFNCFSSLINYVIFGWGVRMCFYNQEYSFYCEILPH